MILLLKTAATDAGYFRQKFDVEILTEFADAFASLTPKGYASGGR